MDFKLNFVTRLESEYKYVINCDLIPFEHIPDTITKVSRDLEKLNSMIVNIETEDLVLRCQKLKVSLVGIIEYLKDKLERFLNVKLDVKCKQ